MAQTAHFHSASIFEHGTNPWQHYQLPNHFSLVSDSSHESAVDDQSIYSGPSETTSPTLISQRRRPEFVQPQDLHPQDAHALSSSPASESSLPMRTGSIDSISSSISTNRHQALRRMSLAAIDLNDDSYRPRSTPARRKKTTTGRITPRSDKHARELELNRKAATKCRNRQKAFIDQLQHRCKREEEKMRIQSSLVSALHDEVVTLRNEVLRQSFCDCRFLNGASLSMMR